MFNWQALSQIHFRQGHFLCEDEGCLAKKFIVFAAESEMKVLSSTLYMMYIFILLSIFEVSFLFFFMVCIYNSDCYVLLLSIEA